MTNRSYFDAIARDYYANTYERPRDRHALNLFLRREACLDLVPPKLDGPVLDLGCGPGAMTIPLVTNGASVVSIDFAREMVAETLRRVHDLGRTNAGAVADATRLPFADGTFALVVTTGVLEYIADLDRALAEIVRVSRPGGTVIATMSLPRRLERLAVKTWSRLNGHPAMTVQFIHDRDSFDRHVEASTLVIEERRCTAFAPFPLDALAPRSVLWIDRWFGPLLNRSELARDTAKTYIIKARKPVAARTA